MALNGIQSTLARMFNNWPIFLFFQNFWKVFHMDTLGMEIFGIAIPAAIAFAADPIASLINIAFIGHLGSVEIAAVGISVAILSQAYKIAIFPFMSIITSFVAEEDTTERLNAQQAVANAHNNPHSFQIPLPEQNPNLIAFPNTIELDLASVSPCATIERTTTSVTIEGMAENGTENVTINMPPNGNSRQMISTRRHIPSAMTALVVGITLGLLQTVLFFPFAKPILIIMGVESDSPMLTPAEKYLRLRAFGAPAVILSFSLQGVFRGLKDTTTPLYAIVAGDILNIILDPILMFACKLGVSGAAIAYVVSKYLTTMILLWKLVKQVVLFPMTFKPIQIARFYENGILLLTRITSVAICVTLALSMVASLGPNPLAAFHVCLQVWLTSSIMADGLAVAAQAIIACAFAEKDYDKATQVATRVIQMGFVQSLGIAIVVGLALKFGSSIFSDDKAVTSIITIGIPFVAATQPLSSMAFIFDGIFFGASDFIYSTYSMAVVATVSIVSMIMLFKYNGFVGICVALAIFMALRTFVGFWRIGTATGPWHFLRAN